MKHLEITRQSDDLNQEVWGFWYYDNAHAIVLDSFRRESRPTTRAKFRVEAAYNRLNKRDSLIKEADVPLPEDVRIEVSGDFMASLRVVKWSAIR